MKKQKWLGALLTLVMLCTAVPVGSTSAASENQFRVSMNLEYQQSEARKMVSYINEFRTGSDAWAWNQENSKKESYSGLPRLTYDYELEKVAMQRAAEIALNFAHKRPNGLEYYTAAQGDARCRAESIATGRSSAWETFRQLKADQEAYSGQTYRRNMLDANSLSVGIGHVVVNGRDFWVQEFGFRNSGAAETSPKNGKTQVSIPVSGDMMTLGGIHVPEKLEVSRGGTVQVPMATIYYKLPNTVYWDLLSLETDVQWQVSNPSIAKLSGTTLSGVAGGSTTLTGQVMGLPLSVPVTVSGNAPQPSAGDGWKLDQQGWYFVYNGTVMKHGWAMDSKGWCYLNGKGYLLTNGWAADSHGWCFMDGTGHMMKHGWAVDSKGWCYLNGEGYLLTNGWAADSHGWCFMDDTGHMLKNGWAVDSKGWCYLNGEGYLLTNGWAKDSHGWCYMDETGHMAKNTTITDKNGTHVIDANGYLVEN